MSEMRAKSTGWMRWHGCGAWLALGGALALPVMAQTAPGQPGPAPTAQKKHAAKSSAVTSAATARAASLPATRPAHPNLLQQPSKPATVTARDNALTVKADNASLSDILRQVASTTGMKLEGLGGDERVFGSFGPAAPREVLTTLLNGTRYNVLMVGALPNGAPRQLVLSRKLESGSQIAPQPDATQQRPSPDDEDTGSVDEPDGPQPAPIIEPAVIPQPGVPEPPAPQQAPGQQPGRPDQPQVRTPQQFLQQIQQQQDQAPNAADPPQSAPPEE